MLLCVTGVLPGLAVTLPAIIRHTIQQQQQQQHSAGDWQGFLVMTEVMRRVLRMWDCVAGTAPRMLRTVLFAVLPLLQHLQACGTLLPADFADCSSSTADSSSSSSKRANPYHGFIEVQCNATLLLRTTAELVHGESQHGPVVSLTTPEGQLFAAPAVSQLVLQLLSVSALVMHKDHATHRQQQRASAASSSSEQQGSQAAASGAKQQHRADLLSIPAFHQQQDVLQLLPGGQAYFDVIPTWLKSRWGVTGDSSAEAEAQKLRSFAHQTHMLTQLMTIHLQYVVEAQHKGRIWDRDDPALSAAAVRLVLELQLLAASWLQRQRSSTQQQQEQQRQQQQQQRRQKQQQQHGVEELLDLPDVVEAILLQSNELLQVQMRAILQASGSSSLPPEVLQQAGLQLLQALAAPLQQLQMSRPEDTLAGLPMEWIAQPVQQLLALRAAAAGVNKMQAGVQGEWGVRLLLLLLLLL
jgi:hypothetical protein